MGEEPKLPNKPNPYLRFMGMSFQMLVTILLFVYLGRKIDQYLHTSKSWYTLGGAIFGILGALYFVIKEVMNTKNKK